MPNTLDLDRLSVMADQFADAQQRAYNRNSCIVGTRLFIECLRRYNPSAAVYALSVECVVMNPTFVRLLGDRDLEDLEADELRTWEAKGASSVWLGVKEEALPGHWPGHLVAIVNRRFLVDPTISQTNRPARDIHTDHGAAVGVINEKFLRGRGQFVGITHTGVKLLYRPRPDDKSFRQTPGWQRPLEPIDEQVFRATLGQWHGQQITWFSPRSKPTLEELIAEAAS